MGWTLQCSLQPPALLGATFAFCVMPSVLNRARQPVLPPSPRPGRGQSRAGGPHLTLPSSEERRGEAGKHFQGSSYWWYCLCPRMGSDGEASPALSLRSKELPLCPPLSGAAGPHGLIPDCCSKQVPPSPPRLPLPFLFGLGFKRSAVQPGSVPCAWPWCPPPARALCHPTAWGQGAGRRVAGPSPGSPSPDQSAQRAVL